MPVTTVTSAVFDLPWWGYVLVTLAFTHLTIIGTTLYLHRSQAHRALQFHPVISHVLRFWLWLSSGQVTQQWVAVHRKHHARVETIEDPHSPQIHGLPKVLFGGVLLYHQVARDAQTLEQFGKGCPNDWLENYVYTPFSWYGPTLMLLLDIALFGWAGILIWLVQVLWIPFWAAGVINGVGHFWGYRNFETPDRSRNLTPWGIIIGGEELHNNHHAFASSACFANKSWELDIGWVYLKLLSKLNLVTIRKTAPTIISIPGSTTIDSETLSVILANRVHVMTDFARFVLRTVCSEELQKVGANQPGVRSQIKQASHLIRRDPEGLDSSTSGTLKALLSDHPQLEMVYTMKQRLLELWRRSTRTNEHGNSVHTDSLSDVLEEWCSQAEASGIAALQDFSMRLRGYAMAG